MSFIPMIFEGQETDIEKNDSNAYWQMSIWKNCDYLPQIEFYSNPNITLGTIAFDLLKLDKQKLSRGIISVTETINLDNTWITTELDSETNRYYVYVNDLYEFDISYDLQEVYQLKVKLDASGENWYSQPFWQDDFDEGVPPQTEILTDQSILQTVGINLTFASGTIQVDWGDSSAIETFTSGVEKTHNYSGTGNYVITISGSLTNITKFIADNSRITQINNLETGVMTEFDISNNLFSGVLDMSLAPVKTKFYCHTNVNLSGITFSETNNEIVTDFRAYNCALTTLDLSNVPISSTFWIYGNSSLTSVTFASSGNAKVTLFYAYSCGLTSLDLTNVPIGTNFQVYSNASLTGITFASSGNSVVTVFQAQSCNLSTITLTNVPIGGQIRFDNNSSLTSITFATSGNSKVTNLLGYNCNLSSLDLTNVPIGSQVQIYNNTSLSSITFSSTGNTLVDTFYAYNCNLSSIDFTNVPIWGFIWLYSNSSLSSITFAGSGNSNLISVRLQSCSLPNIDYSVFTTSNNVGIDMESNSMTATEHDNQLINLDGTGWTGGTLDITTGNTARTSASDTAYNNLIAKSWTIT